MDDRFPWILDGYPRPTLYRENWQMLTDWQLQGRRCHVPFPPQAPLSGFAGPVPEELAYDVCFFWKRKDGRRVLLHFGSVDQCCTVCLNGTLLGQHAGGYLPFSFEITDALIQGQNLLSVQVIDRNDPTYPYGKQTKRPHGMWYTGISGIWQPVWLEEVPLNYIRDVDILADSTGLTLTVHTQLPTKVQVFIDGSPCGTCQSGRSWRWNPIQPKLWSPEHPYLYHLSLHTDEDQVQSYFGLRSIEILACKDGRKHLCLNGRPIFLMGLLDQGYYPGGIYLPTAPSVYTKDISNAKSLGFNLLRKHVKLEPAQYYARCDLEGMLILQDMVNSGGYSFLWDTLLPNLGLKYRPDFSGRTMRRSFFEAHCLETLSYLHAHPSVIGYTIFNEGWGQFDTTRLYQLLKTRDPSRFFISSSGWFKGFETDVESDHIYFRNTILHAKEKPHLLTECGGYVFQMDTAGKSYGYGHAKDREALEARISQLFKQMILPSVCNGLNGCVYTQLTDVEGERNGLYTSDRECKVTQEVLMDLSSRTFQTFYSSL